MGPVGLAGAARGAALALHWQAIPCAARAGGALARRPAKTSEFAA